MCVVSMIADHYRDQFKPWQIPNDNYLGTYVPPAVSKQEFDRLKEKVEEMIALMKRAQEYDARTGQSDCESEDKMDTLRKIAAAVGIDLDAAIKNEAAALVGGPQ